MIALLRRLRHSPTVKDLGPGLITGAADDDPSGIATYSQAGAQFGFSMLWTVVLTYPLMVGIQMVSARIGRVTGHGLAANIQHAFAALAVVRDRRPAVGRQHDQHRRRHRCDGRGAQLLLGGSVHLYAVASASLCLVLQVFLPYQTLRALPQVADAVAAGLCRRCFHDPRAVARGDATHRLCRRCRWTARTLTMIVAVFGTTISPYLFFWQAAQEVEELRGDPAARIAAARVRSRRASICTASSATPTSGWASPISSRSSSS